MTRFSPRDGTLAKNRVCRSRALLRKAATTQELSVPVVPRCCRPGPWGLLLGPLGGVAEGQHPASLSLRARWGPRGGAEGKPLLQKSVLPRLFYRHCREGPPQHVPGPAAPGCLRSPPQPISQLGRAIRPGGGVVGLRSHSRI